MISLLSLCGHDMTLTRQMTSFSDPARIVFLVLWFEYHMARLFHGKSEVRHLEYMSRCGHDDNFVE